MSYETLLLNIEDGVGTLTLNRPEVLNALSHQVYTELSQAAEELSQNDEVRAVIITGGEKVFAAGADIRGMVKAEALEIALAQSPSQKALDLIENMPKPVIAAIAGYALGGGCELTLACDVRIAGENAKIGLPEITLGILPGAGGTQRLPRLIGAGKAKEMIFSGDFIDAQEALRIGLVNKVVPEDQLLTEAKRMAKRFASRGAIALRMAKSAINEGLRMDLQAGLQYEHQCFSLLFATQDQKEGMEAFLQKRRPHFQGK